MKFKKYQNGNYKVMIDADGTGTKIKMTEADNFIAEFPDSFDCKITNYCDMNCAWCHENSSTAGYHGNILEAKFINSLHPYTEIAIGGGNPLAHPDLNKFLIQLREQQVIASMTVNLTHFLHERYHLQVLTSANLIHGLGISYADYMNENSMGYIKEFPNAVIHVINGIITIDDLKKMRGHGLKILILGYKKLRRGKSYNQSHDQEIISRQKDLNEALPQMIKENWFEAISFDNLALAQLDVRKFLSEKEWESFYMGDDGESSMYIDLVKNEYASSSTSLERFPLLDDIKDMFNNIKTI